MRIVSNRENLLKALQIAQRAVSAKNPLPILSGIKIEAMEDRVSFTATDLEIGIRFSLSAEVIEPGSAVLPARYVTEFVRRLPDISVFIESDQDAGSVNFKYGQSEANINGFPVEEFPEFDLPESDDNFKLPAEVLRDAIRQVIFAVSADENRPVFSGVLMEISENQMQMVATDTHRLAWRGIPMEGCENMDLKVIIPGKTLNELTRILTGTDEEVKVMVADNQVVFETGDMCMISRLIDGLFPNYRQVIPQEYVSRAVVKTRDLADATERASLLTRDGMSIVRLNLSNGILVMSVSNEAGNVREELSVFQEGGPIQVAFNSRYLSDVLKVVGSEEICIEFTGPLSPGILKPVEEKKFLSLLLPVRLREE
ncbi:MAG TPA: DNA polymerase III subunit beta [Bacillota bacterium]|nr:DNA polymerase III subunit beta [Bacillota bacterium]